MKKFTNVEIIVEEVVPLKVFAHFLTVKISAKARTY
jgi:hypothetical protein